MTVGSWTRQLLLAIKVVVIEFIDSVSVTIHTLAHREVGAGRAKGLRFVVGIGRGCCNFLASLILNAINVILLHYVASQTDGPAIGARDIGAEGTWLGHVRIG